VTCPPATPEALAVQTAATGIGRIGLAPFRSLHALNDPEHAAKRTVRVLVRGAGCVSARCELPGFEVQHGRMLHCPDGVAHRVLSLPGEGAPIGRLEVQVIEERADALQPEFAFIAQTLGTMATLHRTARVNEGILVSPFNIHLLANITNALRMQLLVISVHRRKGRTEDMGSFLDTALMKCEQLEKFINTLRS
jgi:hypothetical protein